MMVFDRFKRISEQTVVVYFKGISDIANGRGAQIKGGQVVRVTKFCPVALFICWSSIRNLLLVNLLAPKILWLLLDFGKSAHS